MRLPTKAVGRTLPRLNPGGGPGGEPTRPAWTPRLTARSGAPGASGPIHRVGRLGVFDAELALGKTVLACRSASSRTRCGRVELHECLGMERVRDAIRRLSSRSAHQIAAGLIAELHVRPLAKLPTPHPHGRQARGPIAGFSRPEPEGVAGPHEAARKDAQATRTIPSFSSSAIAQEHERAARVSA